MTAPQLSILLPTWNGATFLAEQIDSILAQTASDFELIAVDDGSTDATVAILDGYAARDSRVRRLPASGNAGQRRRLFQLVGEARGQFIAISDQDDVWHPERNARLLAAIGGRALAFGRSQLIDAAGNDLGRSILDALDVDPTAAGPLSAMFQALVSAHAAIVRRCWLDPATLLGALPFDQAMGIDALLSDGLVYVDDAIVLHRLHGANQMNAAAADDEPGRLLSLHRLRTSTDFIRLDRLTLFMTLDQIGRSGALPPDTRRAFARAAAACRYAWYQRLRFRAGGGAALEEGLHELLDPFAGSARDRAFFAAKLRSITRAQFDPVNIVRALTHYRTGRS